MASIKLLTIGNFIAQGQGYASVSDELAVRLQAKGYVVYTASQMSNRVLRLLDMVFKTVISASQVDVVMIDVFSGNAFIWATIIGNLLYGLNVPFILILRGGGLPNYALTHSKRIASLFHKAKAVIAPSFYLQSNLLSYHQNIQIINNPIDIEK